LDPLHSLATSKVENGKKKLNFKKAVRNIFMKYASLADICIVFSVFSAIPDILGCVWIWKQIPKS
jgi:hypothetical protein